MSTLERRIAELEQRTGLVADGFAEHLSEDDAGFYGAVMRRWAKSRQTFEHFIRGLERAELERLLQMHLEVLGMTDDELRAMGESVSKFA